MSTIRYNSFISYDFSDQEQINNSIFNDAQLQHLQNELAMVAECKLNLEYISTDPINYAQQEAYLRGKLDILRYLIDNSKAMSNKQDK